MSVKPILFSGPMIRALIEGRKTQTRRIIKPQPHILPCLHEPPKGEPFWCVFNGDEIAYKVRVPYAIGDLLWVREAWATVNSECGPGWAYRATNDFRQPEYDGEDFGVGPSFNYDKYPGSYTMWFGDLLAGSPDHGWTPSIFMPRWASRLTLEVTDVRVQRLREISEMDAKAEGCPGCLGPNPDFPDEWDPTPREEFQDLWNSINKKHPGCSWADNPWICALTFSVRKGNVDEK